MLSMSALWLPLLRSSVSISNKIIVSLVLWLLLLLLLLNYRFLVTETVVLVSSILLLLTGRVVSSEPEIGLHCVLCEPISLLWGMCYLLLLLSCNWLLLLDVLGFVLETHLGLLLLSSELLSTLQVAHTAAIIHSVVLVWPIKLVLILEELHYLLVLWDTVHDVNEVRSLALVVRKHFLESSSYKHVIRVSLVEVLDETIEDLAINLDVLRVAVDGLDWLEESSLEDYKSEGENITSVVRMSDILTISLNPLI